jgi:hypothetical protein
MTSLRKYIKWIICLALVLVAVWALYHFTVSTSIIPSNVDTVIIESILIHKDGAPHRLTINETDNKIIIDILKDAEMTFYPLERSYSSYNSIDIALRFENANTDPQIEHRFIHLDQTDKASYVTKNNSSKWLVVNSKGIYDSVIRIF